jgi:hypothetical protein
METPHQQQHQIHHFYHAYTNGKWKDKLKDHLHALKTYGLYDNLTSFNIGTVGTPQNHKKLLHFLDETNTKYTIIANEQTGWEQTTLKPLWETAKLNPNAYFVYAHTKGSANYNPINETWRKGMTRKIIVEWTQSINALNSGHSTTGCHYHHACATALHPFWGGNFWWATGTHISNLQQCPPTLRHYAEWWIGTLSENPIYKPYDLWPVGIGTPSDPY